MFILFQIYHNLRHSELSHSYPEPLATWTRMPFADAIYLVYEVAVVEL